MSVDNKIDQYNRYVATLSDGIELMHRDKTIDRLFFSDNAIIEEYNLHVDEVDKLQEDTTATYDEFHSQRSSIWYYPEWYRTLDIRSFLINKCKTEVERQRVLDEIIVYESHNLVSVLRFLIYFVDYMRQTDQVWGVGRGSSVASFILYLIGVHKIDSIKYDLSIREFLK